MTLLSETHTQVKSPLDLVCPVVNAYNSSNVSMVSPTSEVRSAGTPLGTSSSFNQYSKSQRILACILCQKRKIKCNREFPCSNCLKSGSQCVPATVARRRRRRRFPERVLLDRLNKYEDLLRQNNIPFEPLHCSPAGETGDLPADDGYDSEKSGSKGVVRGSPPTNAIIKSERQFEAKNVWHAMSNSFRNTDKDDESSDDDVREIMVKKAWDQSFGDDDHLIFGSRNSTIDLSILHPSPVHIFKLWQIYLDNVNPFLKITHTPSLQGSIIEAAGNVTDINPNLEALLFSIYAIAVLSTVPEDCQTMFGSSRDSLLIKFQSGCQQALVRAGFLRSNDRDCLTAMYLYLITVKTGTFPLSLSSLLGIAIRIAQRMGIHDESALAKCTVLEAEMRRRLWWSLVIFDGRISEVASFKNVTLNPTWDCKIPLNVNDSELRPGMKGPPAVQGMSTETLFVVIRSEIGEFIRNTVFHLEFTNPVLKPIAKQLPKGPAPEYGEVIMLEQMIEDQYLKYCDQENPHHFMTMWTTRAYLAKLRLLEHLSKCSGPSAPRTEAYRDAATSLALSMLECDTKVMESPLTKRFVWLNRLQFPLPAYIQIVQDLRRRPVSERTRQAWEIMSDNYEAWYDPQMIERSPFIRYFANIILKTWNASQQVGETLAPPRFVTSLRNVIAQVTRHARNDDTEQSNVEFDRGLDELLMPMPIEYSDQEFTYSMDMQDGYPVLGSQMYPGFTGQALFDWSTLGGPPS